MKHYELLREIADRLEKNPEYDTMSGMVLNQPRYSGKFPFAGGGAELLSSTQEGNNYWVPLDRILISLGKALKVQREAKGL
jgi:hypothetical protein